MLLTMLLLACRTTPVTASEDMIPVLDLAPPAEGFQLVLGPETLAAHTEQYFCRITQLPESGMVAVAALEHQATPDIHHFNVWGLLTGPGEEVEGDCGELWALIDMALASPLYASQEPSFQGAFQPGTAVGLPGAQWVLMEYHGVNTTDAEVAVEARLNVHLTEGDQVETWANVFYGSNGDIEIPAGESRTFTRQCWLEHDLEILVLASHFHGLGERFTVHRLEADRTLGPLLYENTDWTTPGLVFHTEQPLELAADEGLQYACTYVNDTEQTVTYGGSADDEMCMMVGIYAPDAGFLTCSADWVEESR